MTVRIERQRKALFRIFVFKSDRIFSYFHINFDLIIRGEDIQQTDITMYQENDKV